jgi:ABC-2 type transport system ATP-binding protein
MTNNKPVIDINAMTLYAKDNCILKDITLAVPQGAVVGLVGRNGAGKSSLLRCVVGLETPTDGTVHLLGEPSSELVDNVLANIGYVAQTPDLFDWMFVTDMIRSIGQAYPRWSEERYLGLATQIGLPLGGRIKNLSGGDQQKLAVVLALAHNPDVLLLDEPVSSLDPLTRSNFMRALFADRTIEGEIDRGNALDGRTIVISSHLLTDLERVVSHVAFMREGRLQLFDTWDAMLEHYRLVPSAQSNIVDASVLCRNYQTQQMVIDTRLMPELSNEGRSLTLDELFAELNA